MYTRPCSAVTVTVTATVTVTLLRLYLWLSYRDSVSPGCGYFVKSNTRVCVRLLWPGLQSGETLTEVHVCACQCCFSSYKFRTVMLLLICFRYRYLILVDIWLISTPGSILRLLAGIDNEYQIYSNCVPICVNGQSAPAADLPKDVCLTVYLPNSAWTTATNSIWHSLKWFNCAYIIVFVTIHSGPINHDRLRGLLALFTFCWWHQKWLHTLMAQAREKWHLIRWISILVTVLFTQLVVSENTF